MILSVSKLFCRVFAPLILAVSVIAVGAQPAAAQTATGDDPRVSIAVGAGLARSLHGDLDYYAQAWEVDLGIRRSPRVAFEVDLGQWRRVEEANVAFASPPDLVGGPDGATNRSEHTFTTFGFSVLASGRVGAARISAGGGPGVMMFHRSFRTTTHGCSGSIPCGTTETEFSSVSGTVQAVGRVEVPLTPRVGAFVASRFLVNLRDVGFSATKTTAGVTFGF